MQSPLCCASFMQGQHPRSPQHCAFVRLAWLGWGKKPTEAGSPRLQVGRGNCLPSATGWFLFLVFHLSSFLPVLLFLCRFLPSASCLPHPKSCARPLPHGFVYASQLPSEVGITSTPIFQMRRLRWREGPSPAQGHTAGWWSGQDLNLSLSSFQPALFILFIY